MRVNSNKPNKTLNICVNFSLFDKPQVEFSTLLAPHSFSQQLGTRVTWILLTGNSTTNISAIEYVLLLKTGIAKKKFTGLLAETWNVVK